MKEQLLKDLKFVRCERGRYYRMKLYENVFLEVDTEDYFASLVKINTKDKRHPITKICLPNKLNKVNLIKLLEVFGILKEHK